MCVQLQTCHTGLDGGISVVFADAEDAVHLVECDAERAFGCDNGTFDPGSGAVRDDGCFIFRTDFDGFGDFGVGFRENDGIWQRASVIGGVACVCIPDGVICAETCAEQVAEFFMCVF